MVGDGEGVVVIPAGIAEEVAFDAAEQDLFETFVTERVRAGQTIFGLYPPDDASKQAFAAWKAAQKR
jgi:regulator of RNase E activity RraA